MPDHSGPLVDVVVVDFADGRAELAGRILAELGALVVKIEPPEGSNARRVPPFVGRTARSLYWEAVAAGKHSAIVELSSPSARAQLEPLLRRADILIESADPGHMAALSFGYDEVAKLNPGIIYVSVTPYGQGGPDAASPATELTLEAASGLLGLQGDEDRPPVSIGYPQAAFHAGVQAAADAIIALNARGDDGPGQYLDVSMQTAMVWTLMNATGYPSVTGHDPPGTGAMRKSKASAIPGVTMPVVWKCADGWITCAVAGGRQPGRAVDRWLHGATRSPPSALQSRCGPVARAPDATTGALAGVVDRLPRQVLRARADEAVTVGQHGESGERSGGRAG